MGRLFALLILVCLLLPVATYQPTPQVWATTSQGTSQVRASEAAPLGQWYLATIGALTAWTRGADGLDRATGQHVKVLVIDTGLDAAAATSLFTPTTVLASWTAFPGVSPHQDSLGHGTFVAGELAASGTAESPYGPYYGVCPQCRVAMARVFNMQDGASSADIARAYRWGVDHGFQVISMSLGGSGEMPGMADAIAYGHQHGVVCVAAAGNDYANQPSYPGSYPGCLRVAATDMWGQVADFSDGGPDVGIAAPGVGILGYVPAGASLGPTGWQSWDGTSMATPLVAGALADIMSLGVAPALAVAALEAGASRVPGMDPTRYGAGIVNLPGALAALDMAVR